MASVKEIDNLLPQTQCGECGFEGCLPYAEALACGQAEIDLCPPGGVNTMRALAKLLNLKSLPYEEKVRQNTRQAAIAKIRESECIGCTKCIQACPVDAIIGSAKQMHAVIVPECTGCGLCVEPCPVDCIDMIAEDEAKYDKQWAKARYQARQVRIKREAQEKSDRYRQKRLLVEESHAKKEDKLAKQDYIRQAMARVKAKKHE
jgi:electron transport complex protein RnfB